MRRTVGTGLVGLGVFLIVAAGLIRFYAYPTLARVPTNYDTTTRLESIGAKVFNTDPKVLAPETTDLSVANRTVADSGATAPDGVAVWNSNTTITRADGSVFQQSRQRVPFDAVSGAGVKCASCGSWNESTAGRQDATVYTGQVFKFPFNTQKHDYQNWDDTLGEATTAKYVGETTVKGLGVYKFVQTIPSQVVDHESVPGSVFGKDAPSVDADMVYSMTRTLYIEPATGTPVQRVEVRDQELRYDGVSVPAFVGTVQYTDAQVADEVHTVKTNATILAGARSWIPLLAVVLGLLALGGGLVLPRRGAGAHSNDKRSTENLVGV